MIVAYTPELKQYAEKLKNFDINIVSQHKAMHYDVLIYMHDSSNSMLSSIHPDSPVLFLDVTNIAPKDAINIIKSNLYSPLF